MLKVVTTQHSLVISTFLDAPGNLLWAAWDFLHGMAFSACHGIFCMPWHFLHGMGFPAWHGISCMAWHFLHAMAFSACHGIFCMTWHFVLGMGFPVPLLRQGFQNKEGREHTFQYEVPRKTIQMRDIIFSTFYALYILPFSFFIYNCILLDFC